MTRETRNPAASILARLLRYAKERGFEYENVLTTYCLERFLYRLGLSPFRGRYLLKGAMLLRAWSSLPYRPTRDLDLLGREGGGQDALREDVKAICSVAYADDCVVFHHEGVSTDLIREESENAGVRVKLPASLGTARVHLQIDVGAGDSVWPAAVACDYPALLDLPAPAILTYPREAVVAEKLDAIVSLGDASSRIKDHFDLHHLARTLDFHRLALTESVRRTFEKRGTTVPASDPVGLTHEYWANPSRPAQVRAFARRAGMPVGVEQGEETLALVWSFVGPILADLRAGVQCEGRWPPGGPWS